MAQTEIDLLREIRDSLKSGSRSFSGGGGGSSGGGGGSNLGSFSLKDILTDATKGVANGMDSLFRGSMDASKALSMMTSTLNIVPFVGKLSGGIQQFGEALIDANAKKNEAGKYGADFNNNLLAFNEKVSGAGLTLDQYTSILRDNSTALAGLGATSNKAQSNFLELAKGFREDGTVRQLQSLGLSAEEAAQYMVVSLANQTRLDVYSEKGKREAIENTMALANVMEETSRITGLSRKQQQEDLQAATAKAQNQAALRMLPPEAQARFELMHASLAGFGGAIQDLSQEIFTGGVRTKAGGDMLAALGPAGVMLEKAVIANKNAHTAAEKTAAEQMMSQAQLAVNNRMMEKSFNEMGVYVTSGAGDAVRSMIEQNKTFSSTQAGLTEAQLHNKNATLEEIQAKQKAAANLEMQGKDPTTGKPFEDAGSKLGESINRINASLTDVTAGFNKNVHSAMNSVDAFGKALDAFNKSDLIRARTQEESAAGQIKMFTDAGKAIKDTVDKVIPSKFTDHAINTTASPNGPLHSMYLEGVKSRASGSPGMTDFLNGGSFDKIFEQFDPQGELAILHGEEVVANKQQMMQFRAQLTEQVSNLIHTTTKSSSKTSPIQPIVDEIHTAIAQVPKPETPTELKTTDLTSSIQKIATPIEKNAIDASAKIEDATKSVKFPDLTQTFAKVGDEIKSVFANVKQPETKEVLSTIGEDFKKITADIKPNSFDELFNNVKSDFNKITDNIHLPNFDELSKDFQQGFNAITDVEVPNFGELFDNAKTGFDKITDGFELPDVSGMMTDIGSNFSSITDGFKIPDFDLFADDIDDKLTATTDKLELPDVNNLFKDANTNLTNVTSEFKLPDANTLFSDFSKSLTTITDKSKEPIKDTSTVQADVDKELSKIPKVEQPDATKIANSVKSKIGEDISKNNGMPDFDKLFASVGDSFVSAQKEQLKDTNAKISSLTKDASTKIAAIGPNEHKVDIAKPNPAQIKVPDVSKPLNTTKINEPKPATETQKQADQPKPAPTPAPAPVNQQNVVHPVNETVTMKDLMVQLENINKTLQQIEKHSSDTIAVAQKQVRATKGLSNDRFA